MADREAKFIYLCGTESLTGESDLLVRLQTSKSMHGGLSPPSLYHRISRNNSFQMQMEALKEFIANSADVIVGREDEDQNKTIDSNMMSYDLMKKLKEAENSVQPKLVADLLQRGSKKEDNGHNFRHNHSPINYCYICIPEYLLEEYVYSGYRTEFRSFRLEIGSHNMKEMPR